MDSKTVVKVNNYLDLIDDRTTDALALADEANNILGILFDDLNDVEKINNDTNIQCLKDKLKKDFYLILTLDRLNKQLQEYITPISIDGEKWQEIYKAINSCGNN